MMHLIHLRDLINSMRRSRIAKSIRKSQKRHGRISNLATCCLSTRSEDLEFRRLLSSVAVQAAGDPTPAVHGTTSDSSNSLVPSGNYDPTTLTTFLVNSAHQYDHSANPSDLGSPAVFLYTDYFAGGAYTNITASGGLASNGLDGDDPLAARGTSSFRITTQAADGYVEFGLAKSNNSPRDIAAYGTAHSLRFWAMGQSAGQAMTVNILEKTASGYAELVVQTKTLTTGWSEYVVNLPLSPKLSPSDLYSVQFQLPLAGTVRLDEIRLDTDGTDPLQLIQSYVPGGWAAADSIADSAAGRDATVYPNRSFLYDIALSTKALIASDDSSNQTLALSQVDAVLATNPTGNGGYFDELSSGYVLLADGSARTPNSQLRAVGDNSWFGLSLLDSYRLTGNTMYLTRARQISDWIDANLKASGPLEGYYGGYDVGGQKVTWRGSEENIDAFELNQQIAAILTQQGNTMTATAYSDRAAYAATFVISMFDSTDGKFWTGTTTGDTINTSSVPLDSQLWPILTLKLSPQYATAIDWNRALNYAETNLVQTGGSVTGFTFSSKATADRVWAEGVAQGVAVYNVLGESTKASAGLSTLESLVGPRGGVLAVSGGTMEDKDLKSAYDPREAIAPSSWSFLDHLGLNPFDSSVPPNHAPVGKSGTVATAENTPYTLKTADFGFTDPNDYVPNTLQTVKFTLLPTVGTLKDNGVALTVNQFVSAADISGGKLIFTPKANLIGGPLFLCKFQVQDNGGTAAGGINLDPNAKVLDINIVIPNHAPTGTSGTLTSSTNTPYPFKTADFGFADPNDHPSNTLLAVKFALLPTVGILKDNGVALTVNQFVSAADISGGRLIFTPNTNATGGPFFLCKFQVEDNGGTAAGGVNLDPTAKILDVKIVSPNHAPAGKSGTLTTLENRSYTFKIADFGFTDPNDSPPNTLLAVKLTLLPAAGTLTDNDVAVTANQFVSAADIIAGKLVFTPKAKISGGPFFLCKFQVEDNGGTANGGVNLDPTAKVLDITITKVN